MARASTVLTALFGVVLALAGSGCGGPEEYVENSACGIDTEYITPLTGTGKFAVESAGADLPFQSGDASEFTCQVSLSEDTPTVIDVTARLTSTSELAGYRTNVDAAEQTFEAAGGSAGISTSKEERDGETVLDYKGWWACAIDSSAGTPVIYVTGETASGSDDDVKDLVGALADRAGCRAAA